MIIVTTNFTDDEQQALKLVEDLRGAPEWMQVDVMDDTYVPGHTFDFSVLEGKVDDFKIEVHLMVNDPVQYFEKAERIGAKRVYVHIDPFLAKGEDLTKVLSAMSKHSFQKGIAISPPTPLRALDPYVDEINAVLVMLIEPGGQGRALQPEMLERVSELKKKHPGLFVAVDGGVNADTAKKVAAAGTDAAGVGSAINRADNPAEAFQQLQAMVA